MDRTIIDLPCDLFAPVMRDWHLDARGRSAGDGVTGDGQVVYSSRAKWVARLDVMLTRRDRILAWGAIMARMRGRVNLLRICLCAPYRPLPRDILSPSDLALVEAGLPHSDDSFFSDDTGYSYSPTVSILAAAPAGSTSLSIDGDEINDLLEPGHWFSISDWLYRVTGMSGSGAATVITFEPPLRRAVTTANEIALDASVIMAFETDAEGRSQLDAGRRGTATLNLVEWTNRP